MFRLSPEFKYQSKIHNLISNGYRFALVKNDQLIGKFRYEGEANRIKVRGALVVPMADLLSKQVEIL